MHVVDSSGWLEYFANGENADFFAEPLADTPALIVPAISIFEAFKRLLMQRDEASALQAAALIQAGKVVPLDESLAMTAAKLSCELKLPLSDSFMLGTARQFEAVLWTQDADFWGVPGVCYVAKVAGC
jgi:predicted nucleic acid-binding protein